MIRKHEGISSDIFKPNRSTEVSELKETVKLLNQSLKESTSLASKLQLENINLMAENASLQFRMIELNKQLKK